jgi:hypothetical protein
MLFNSKEEFYQYVDYLNNLNISQESIFKIHNFLKFSPNKFARKIEINEEDFQKEFNQIKKPLHLKCLTFKKITKLKDYRPELGIYSKFLKPTTWDIQKWEKIDLVKSMCICKKNLKDNLCFYETIYYSYCVNDNIFYVFSENNSILEMDINIFNQHFIDYREWVIDSIVL